MFERDRFKRWLTSAELRFWLLLLAWLLVFVTIRGISLEADPPQALPNGRPSQELWAEGAAKAQEARNWALFGRWQTNPADNYQFWRPQAPVWVYSLAGFLKLFGVTLVSHRAHSIAVAGLGFVLVLLYARRRLSSTAWGVLALLLAGNFYYVIYTRVGLIEPMVNLFAVAVVFCCYRALAQPLWLLPATWALLLAVFSKMSGLYVLPLLVLCAVVSYLRHRALGKRLWLLIGSQAGVLSVLVALYMKSDVYQQRVVWVIAHMAYNRDGQTEVDFGRISLWDVPARLADADRWQHFLSLVPVSFTLALVACGAAVVAWWRKRTLDWDVLTLLWFLVAWAPLQLTDSKYVRFYLVVFPPLALLGARGLDVVLVWLGSRPWLRLTVVAAVVVTFLGVHGGHYSAWYEKRTFSVRDTNRKVRKLVGDRQAVFVGMWAPWLMFETPYEFYTVRNYFNVTKPALSKLGVTHLLLRPKDLSGARFRQHFPQKFKQKKLLKRFRVRGERLGLYELGKQRR